MVRGDERNWLPGWKVITAERFSPSERYWAVEYRRHHVTRPHPACGPLTVFTAPEPAKDFARTLRGARVVPCAYLPSDAGAAWTYVAPGVMAHRTVLWLLLPGTALAEAVYCFE